MHFPFKLKSTIGRSYNVEPEDVLRTKATLKSRGYYTPRDQQISPYPDQAMFTGIERFQRDNGLHVDGIMRPEGETLRAINSAPETQANGESEKTASPEQQQAAAVAIPAIVYKVAEFLGMSAMAAWAWWQTLSDKRKQAIIQEIEGEFEDDGQADEKEDCEHLHYKVDIPTCNAIARRRGKRAGALCRETAVQRYAACLKGAPKENWPPLNTWNN